MEIGAVLNNRFAVVSPIGKGAMGAATGYLRPQAAWFNNYWGPFGDAFTKIIEGTVTPTNGYREACAAMNAANGK